MLIVNDEHVNAVVVVDDIPIELVGLDRYYKYLKKIKRNKLSTIKNKLDSLYHFWLWTLCNEVEYDEDIQLYFARYLIALKNGFKVISITHIDEFNEDVENLLYESRPKQFSTIEKEKRAVESFLKYTNIVKSSEFDLKKNFLAYNQQAKYNKGSSYGLKMSRYMQDVLLDDESILPSHGNPVKGDIKAFPFQLFDELLEVANPREKLIYLLCGACSALSIHSVMVN